MSDPFRYINGLTMNPPKAKILLFVEEPLLAFAPVFLFFLFFGGQACHLKCQMRKTLD